MSTSKKLEYVHLSRDFDFPDDIEDVLENDYAVNSHYYSVDILKCVQAARLLRDSSPDEVIELIRVWNENKLLR